MKNDATTKAPSNPEVLAFKRRQAQLKKQREYQRKYRQGWRASDEKAVK